jgi:hypothetical protein
MMRCGEPVHRERPGGEEKEGENEQPTADGGDSATCRAGAAHQQKTSSFTMLSFSAPQAGQFRRVKLREGRWFKAFRL